MLQAGDVVRLKSGGPAMVIESAISSDVVNCVWFSHNLQRYNAIFGLHLLTAAQPDAWPDQEAHSS
ncbi:MAG: DUF2158 domain-containing protein [Pseudomonadota bacterium]